jgi:hypothetical protein
VDEAAYLFVVRRLRWRPLILSGLNRFKSGFPAAGAFLASARGSSRGYFAASAEAFSFVFARDPVGSLFRREESKT